VFRSNAQTTATAERGADHPMPNLLDHKVRRTHGLSQKPPRHPGGAASLPAMSVPAVAVGDPEFFAIGEKMRPLIGPYFEAKKKSDAAYRQA